MTAKQTHHVTSKDGTRIEYDVLGAGPALVIVNGALAVRDFVFAQKMADELAKSFTVYNYDRRGRGGSAKHTSASVKKEIDDLDAVCTASGGEPFVVGFSSGAALALEAAAAGVAMKALYAYEPPYVKEDPDGKIDADYQTRMEAFAASGQRSEAVTYFMRTVGVPGIGVAVMKLLPMWKVMKATAHTLPYDGAVMGDFHVPAKRLAASKVPTTVGYGEKTPKPLQSGAKAAQAAVPKSRLDVVPKSNHGVKPKVMLGVLQRAFL